MNTSDDVENGLDYENVIKDAFPKERAQKKALLLFKKLLREGNTSASIEEMLITLMVAAHFQAMELTRLANTDDRDLWADNTRANIEAMSFMRVFSQLVSMYMKFRKQEL